MGEDVFLVIGEKSATHNLDRRASGHDLARRSPRPAAAHAADLSDVLRHRPPHLRTAADNKAILRTYDAPTFSRHDCLTVVGWHRKAIEMCGAKNVSVTETKCRAKGAEFCEYVCEWE